MSIYYAPARATWMLRCGRPMRNGRRCGQLLSGVEYGGYTSLEQGLWEISRPTGAITHLPCGHTWQAGRWIS